MSRGYLMGWGRAALLMLATAVVMMLIAGLGSSQITISLYPKPVQVHEGDIVNLTYIVTNQGAMNLTNVTIFEPDLGRVVIAGMDLLPGEELIANSNYTVTAADYNPALHPRYPYMDMRVQVMAENSTGFPFSSASIGAIKLI